MWGTGKTHVAAAVALAASTNLPQKEQRHGRPSGMRFGFCRCCDHFWISLKTGDNGHGFCNRSWWIMTNIMTYTTPGSTSTWAGTWKRNAWIYKHLNYLCRPCICILHCFATSLSPGTRLVCHTIPCGGNQLAQTTGGGFPPVEWFSRGHLAGHDSHVWSIFF